jgi:hypothetical protein
LPTSVTSCPGDRAHRSWPAVDHAESRWGTC